MTRHSAADVCMGFSGSPLAVAFCRRAIGSPIVASLVSVALPQLLGGCPVSASGRWAEDWWLSKPLALTASRISAPLNMYVSLPVQNTSDRRCFLFRFSQRLCTNAVIWKRLSHPNVVSFLGLGSDSPPISLVYPWMSNGNLSEYLRKRADANKLGLVRVVTPGRSSTF